jgi:hypothetical protein
VLRSTSAGITRMRSLLSAVDTSIRRKSSGLSSRRVLSRDPGRSAVSANDGKQDAAGIQLALDLEATETENAGRLGNLRTHLHKPARLRAR